MADAEVLIEDGAPQDVEMASAEHEAEADIAQTGAEESGLTTIEPDEPARTTFLEYVTSSVSFAGSIG